MGFRGPAPKPTAIKKIQGNPGKRPLNENEPQLEPGIPECPDYLDEIARKEWARIAFCQMLRRALHQIAGSFKAHTGLLNHEIQRQRILTVQIAVDKKTGSTALNQKVPRVSRRTFS